MNAIEIKDLTKRYGNLTAVNSLSLNIKQGEFFAMWCGIKKVDSLFSRIS